MHGKIQFLSDGARSLDSFQYRCCGPVGQDASLWRIYYRGSPGSNPGSATTFVILFWILSLQLENIFFFCILPFKLVNPGNITLLKCPLVSSTS